MTDIYVDADASPVKGETVRVAKRYNLKVFFVSNCRMRMPDYERAEKIIVSERMDAADDWIVEHLKKDDIVISADVPLASRCIKKGAVVLDPNGRILNEETIGEALSHRDIMTFLRETGSVVNFSPPYHKKYRSRFLQKLDDLIQAKRREAINRERHEKTCAEH
ncbi:MAG TPA: YaiI/YqxD family protein [Syntrophorhabdaceae bacterium]|nr:YaiI/YqxD family protein [Syntrophorhabdaceae bacterium]